MAKKISDCTRRKLLAAVAASGVAAQFEPAFAQFDIGSGINALIDVGRALKGLDLDEDDEIRLGEMLYGPTIDQMGGLYRNGAVQRSVKSFAAPIFETTERSRFSWDIVVLDNNAVNAWAMPGGKVAINKGLLRYINSEHELAAVVAHEMGHAERSHAIAAMKKKSVYEGLSGAAQNGAVAALGGDIGAAGQLGMMGLQSVTLNLVTSAYSRDAEREADAHIITAFGRTGHDINEGVGIYRTLLELIPKKSKGTTSLFAGHPETQERLDTLIAAAPTVAYSGTTDPRTTAPYGELKEPFPTRMVYRRTKV